MRPTLLALLPLVLLACKAEEPEAPEAPDEELVPDTPDPFEDLNPDPHIFEAQLRAREANVDIGPEVARLLTYGARLPGPEIRVTQGDRVIVHLENQLPEDFPTTIHWHGIEGTNHSDGTPTTQAAIASGQRFTYDFRTPRPGIFWFHPHIRGAQSTHSGLYGTLVVADPDEQALIDAGILPRTRYTLALSDLGTFRQRPISVESDDGLVLMNGTEGRHLLVNGQVMPTYDVPAGEGVRLQVVNTSIARYWRLAVPGHTLYRVGGQGGLLERVRVEGGAVVGQRLDEDGAVLGTEEVQLGYDRGEILLAPGERADLVLVLDGEPGDTAVLRWEDFARGRHGMWIEDGEVVMGDALDDGKRPGSDVAVLRVVEGGGGFHIAEGDPVLEALGRQIEPVAMDGEVLDWTGELATELQETMDMFIDEDGVMHHLAEFFIDGYAWHGHHFGGPEQPLAPSARHARIGDTIRWEIRNTTTMAHPFHLHGFSYQPIAFLHHGGEHGDHRSAHEPVTRWEVEHVEFEDTTHIPAHTSLILHVHLEDPNGDGGAAGRWMKHCHIFQHGESGMMSELVVSP